MADKRMFSKTVVGSDAFLEMPLTSQALYFHLGMYADDDGFVNAPKRILRMINGTDGDARNLISSGFIIPFDSGVVVIKHWHVNNWIKNDRYKGTICQQEKALLFQKTNKEYTLDSTEEKPLLETGTGMEPEWNQTGTGMDTQISIDKNSIDKGSNSGASAPNRKRFSPPSLDEVREYMTEYASKHGMQIDAALQAEKFCNHHESKGWTIGKSGQKMKRWKGAVGTWMCNLREWNQPQKQQQAPRTDKNDVADLSTLYA